MGGQCSTYPRLVDPDRVPAPVRAQHADGHGVLGLARLDAMSGWKRSIDLVQFILGISVSPRDEEEVRSVE